MGGGQRRRTATGLRMGWMQVVVAGGLALGGGAVAAPVAEQTEAPPTTVPAETNEAQGPAPTEAAPATSTAQVVDGEAPPVRRPPAAPPLAPAGPMVSGRGGPPHVSGTLLGLRFGFAGGGTTLARAQASDGSERKITAGAGATVALVGALTPVWTETFGIGIGIELGWKGQEIKASNGSISMGRFPLVTTAHLLAQVADFSYVTIVAGVQYDFGISLETSGVVPPPDFTLESGLGLLAGLGYHHAFGQHFTLDGVLRFVKLDYQAAGNGGTGIIEANHVAFLLGANYHFEP